jgi:hypothetical protein
LVTAAIRRLRRQAPQPWLTIRITVRSGVAQTRPTSGVQVT